MKRFFAFSQALVIVLLCLASCAVAPAGGADTASTTVLKTFRRRDPAMYIKPPQKDHTPEEEQTIDYYYGELIRLYPRLAVIPREMLRTSVDMGEYPRVKFAFYFGGLRTECEFIFSSGPAIPEGHWRISEDEFSQYYGRGLTEEQMDGICSAIIQSIGKFVEEKKLDGSDLSVDECAFYWQVTKEEQIFLTAEYIASKTPQTTKNLGCGDHAHDFARALVDLSSDDITFTAYPASGG